MYFRTHVFIGNVNDAEVQERGSEDPPPLVRPDGGRSEVSTPVKNFLRAGLGEGDAAHHHSEEDHNF